MKEEIDLQKSGEDANEIQSSKIEEIPGDIFLENCLSNNPLSRYLGINTTNNEELKSLFNSLKQNFENSPKDLGIESVCTLPVSYPSITVNDKLLSGRIYYPLSKKCRAIILANHYTITADKDCPSKNINQFESASAFNGFLVVMPDYIGYGESVDMPHPYLHAESSARSSVDMLKYVKGKLDEWQLELQSDEIYILGYSQGAGVSVAVQKMIENENICKIKRTYVGGGPYDPETTYQEVVKKGVTGIPAAIPLIAIGMKTGEPVLMKEITIEDCLKGFIREQYKDLILSKKYQVAEIYKKMGTNKINEILSDDALNPESTIGSTLIKALRNNTVVGWKPKSEMYIFHSNSDDVVPVENAHKLVDYYKTQGYFPEVHELNFGDHTLAGGIFFIHTLLILNNERL